MPSGSCSSLDDLPPRPARILDDARRAVLSTVDTRGRAHSVPVCFARRGDGLISAIDHKPKSTTRLARVRNIERSGQATLLADHYEEEWPNVGWVMVRAQATVEDAATGVEALKEKYRQYREDPPDQGLIVLTPMTILWWTYT